MIVTTRINGETEYNLQRWNTQDFAVDPVLIIETDDFSGVKEVFDKLNKIEIFVGGTLIASYNQYTGYGSIEFVPNLFDENRNAFFDCVKINLTQPSLVDAVNTLSKKVNGVVDVDNMSADEYKEYLVSTFSDRGQKEIFDGTSVVLSDGSSAVFTYNFEDQLNILSALSMIEFTGMDALIPFHSHLQPCKLFTAADILTVYISLQIYSTERQTRVNMLNNYVRRCKTKEEAMAINYDSPLPDDLQQKYTEIVNGAMNIVAKVKERFFGNASTESASTNTPEVGDSTSNS